MTKIELQKHVDLGSRGYWDAGQHILPDAEARAVLGAAGKDGKLLEGPELQGPDWTSEDGGSAAPVPGGPAPVVAPAGAAADAPAVTAPVRRARTVAANAGTQE